ncbi:MAG: hypothetical protein V7L23_15240 [Nostoc sp.]|uniref:hypothetical protein n=1 Tax=Nostoc sp. TaxID=1180 RepID=UPI002FF1449B
MTYISGQYQTQKIDQLTIQKGVTFRHPISTSADLRGCLLFGEIRRSHPGRVLVENFSVSTTAGQTLIIVNASAQESDVEILQSLNVREGDIISIIGAGIKNSYVLAVSGRAIFIDQVATRSLQETRMSVKAPVLATFTFVPKSEIFRINLTATAQLQATSLVVNGTSIITSTGNSLVFSQYKALAVTRVPTSLKAGNTLVFNKNNLPFDVVLAADVVPGSITLSIEPTDNSLPQGAGAIVGSATLTTREEVRKGDRQIAVRPMKCPVPKDSFLNFGYKDESGWQRVGVAKVSASVLENSLFVPIYSYSQDQAIPVNSIAYFGSSPISNFYAILEADETVDIETGDNYACDIISVSADGSVDKICQITNITFTDIWTDV